MKGFLHAGALTYPFALLFGCLLFVGKGLSWWVVLAAGAIYGLAVILAGFLGIFIAKGLIRLGRGTS